CDAGDVVGFVAAYTFVVGHLVGPQTSILFDDFGLVVGDRVGDPAPRSDHFDVRIDQLQQIVVAAEDDDIDALGDGFDRQRANDVVGLAAFDLEQRHLHRLEHAPAPGDLVAQPGWRR